MAAVRSGGVLAALLVLMGAALVVGLRTPGPPAPPDARRNPAAHAS